jgi:hypothetical protein
MPDNEREDDGERDLTTLCLEGKEGGDKPRQLRPTLSSLTSRQPSPLAGVAGLGGWLGWLAWVEGKR